MREYKGKLKADNIKVGIVVARFNEHITQNLLHGALDALDRFGVPSENITVAWTPGSYEIPLVTKQLALSENYDAIICLGAVIRGATAHFDYVAGEASSGIAKLSLELNIPVIFGILTTDTIEQAVERAGTKAGNKGFDAAQTAIEMIDLLRQLRSSKKDTTMSQRVPSITIKEKINSKK